jgi:hypothetical protein
LKEAETSYREALAIKTDYVEAMNYLAIALQDLGRLREAEILLRQAIARKPDYADAHNHLGFLLRQMGQPEEAAASFKVARSLFEPHLVLHLPAPGIARSIDMAQRYVRVSADLARWSVTGNRRPDAWTDYRLLHQASNGCSSNFFSDLLRRLPGKRRAFPEWRESPIFPWVSPDDAPKILDALERDGLYVFDQLLAPSLVDDMVAYATTAEARLVVPSEGRTHAVFDPAAPIASGYQFNEEKMLQQTSFQKFMGDPLLLAIAQAYFGVEPRLAYLVMWWSTALTRNPTSDMAQLFHADLAHLKWLKTFIYLTDVTVETGAHSFVLGSHKSDEEGRMLRQRGLVRVSDEDIVNAYGSDRVVDLVGSRGTVFIADSRGFHKGHNPRKDHRLVLQVYHVNSRYPDKTSTKQKRVTPTDLALIESIKRHPKVYAGYAFENRALA